MLIKYYGYNSFVVESGDKKVAFDPGGELYLPRWLKPIIPKIEWQTITHIFVTHGDPDHYWHADRVATVSGATIICGEGLVKEEADKRLLNHPRKRNIEYSLEFENLYTIKPDVTLHIDGMTIRGVKTSHGDLRIKFGPSGNIWAPFSFTKTLKAGYGERVGLGAIGFDITINDKRIVNLGDTLLLADEWSKITSPDVLMIPIGGRSVHNTMNENEALEAVKIIKPKMVIPCHYNCPAFFNRKANPADDNYFLKEVQKLGLTCLIMKRGNCVSVS